MHSPGPKRSPDGSYSLSKSRRTESEQDSESGQESSASQRSTSDIGSEPIQEDHLEAFKQTFKERMQGVISKAGTNNEEIPQNRRLDSLARLIEGDGACAAVCFDGEKLLIAGNKGACNLAENYLNYFRSVATGSKDSSEYVKELLKTSLKAGDGLTPEKLGLDLEKIITSLSPTAHSEVKFDDKIIKALHDESTWAIIDNTNFHNDHSGQPNADHAEMKIIQQLIDDKKLTGSKEKLYIGVSRLCCAHCALAIEAVNASNENVVVTPYSGEKENLGVRGVHGKVYEKWPIPPFLYDEDIFKKFLGEKAYESYDKLTEENRYTADQYITDVARDFENSSIGTTRHVPSVSPDRGNVVALAKSTAAGASTTTGVQVPATPRTNPTKRNESPERKS